MPGNQEFNLVDQIMKMIWINTNSYPSIGISFYFSDRYLEVSSNNPITISIDNKYPPTKGLCFGGINNSSSALNAIRIAYLISTVSHGYALIRQSRRVTGPIYILMINEYLSTNLSISNELILFTVLTTPIICEQKTTFAT